MATIRSQNKKGKVFIWHLWYSHYTETSSLNIFLISLQHLKTKSHILDEKYSSGPEGRFGPGQHLWLTSQLQTWLNLPINPVGLYTCPTTNMSGLSICAWGDSSSTHTCTIKMMCDLYLSDCVCANVFVLDCTREQVFTCSVCLCLLVPYSNNKRCFGYKPFKKT